MKVDIKIEGVEELTGALQKMVLGCDDFRPYWNDVQKEFFAIEKAQFDSEGAAGKSGKWKALSPAYAAIKRAGFGNAGILQRERNLYSSLTSKSGDTVFNPKKAELELGTTDRKAMYHQRDTSKMPAREPISVNTKQAEQLVLPIKQGLEKLAESLKLKA
jgi:phage gpG-like protein